MYMWGVRCNLKKFKIENALSLPTPPMIAAGLFKTGRYTQTKGEPFPFPILAFLNFW